MSIIRFINDRNRKNAQLRRIIQYVTRGGRLSGDYMFGQGISPDTAYEEMLASKHMFHQANGKQYTHLVVSCDHMMREIGVVHKIGMELAGFYRDYQVLIATHSDTENLHCHLVINSVNMQTGKKISQRRKDFWNFLGFANSVFEQHGLPYIDSEQMYEILLPETDYCWADDLCDFDDEVTSRLEELQLEHGVRRPIFYLDEEADRLDKLRAIARMEQLDFS